VKAEWGVSSTNRRVRICKLTAAGAKNLEREVSSFERMLEGITRDTTKPSGRSSTVSPDLADPVTKESVTKNGPSRHQTIQAKAHRKNDPSTPSTRLSDRNTESARQPCSSTAISS